MILPFWVSCLCILLWGCICFPPQKGSNIAHGYSLNDKGFSSHADVLGSQASKQFHSGAALNTNHDSLPSPGDEMQAMKHQSFVSLQREPAHQENDVDASTVTSLSAEMVINKPDSGHEQDKFSVVSSTPSLQKYEYEHSGYQHPFGLLVKEHTQKKSMEGVSFPTIKDFRQFIETMKSSFLTPGNDLRTHFQTAREIIKNEAAAIAQNRESDTGHNSNSAKEGPAHDDASENEVWSEPMNTVFEQSEQDTKYQMPRESLSVPVDFTVGLISTTVYDNQDSSPDSALYPLPHLAATEHVSSSYGSFGHGGISGENPNIFTSAPDQQHEDVGSTSYKLLEQMPAGSLFVEDLSFSGHVSASPVNRPYGPSKDFSYLSSKTSSTTPLTSEKNIQQQNYKSHSKDSLSGYRKPFGGFELGEDFQSEELGRVTPANVLSEPKPPSLNSYAKSIYVGAPKGQHHIPDHLPKPRERPAPSFQPYQPTIGSESKDKNYAPNAHLPVSTGSFSSSSDNLSPQSSGSYVGVLTSSPHYAQNQAFSTKQPVRSNQMFTVEPSSSLHGSSRHIGYLGDQRVGVTHPSILTEQAIGEEEPDLTEQNPVSAIQESKQMTHPTLIPISGGLDLTLSGISSLVGVDYANFNSLTNLAPTSASSTTFSLGNEVMSRNFEIKNIISDRFPTGDIHDARWTMGSFSTPQRRGMSLNSGYVGATRAGLLQTFLQPTKVRKEPANVNKERMNMAYWPPKPLRNGGNRKRFPPQKGHSTSPPSINSYVVKSRNGYVRGKVSQSKTYYAPYQLDEYKLGKGQWKPAPQQSKYRNTVSHNAKGFEED